MAGPDDLNDRLRDDREPERQNQDVNKTGGSSGVAGSDIRGRTFPNEKLQLTFYAHERTVVRKVEIEAGLSESEQFVRISEAMAPNDWHEMGWIQIDQEQTGVPPAPVIELPVTKKPWGPRWAQPSIRTLEMERNEPGLFAALKARAAARWKFPLARGDSE